MSEPVEEPEAEGSEIPEQANPAAVAIALGVTSRKGTQATDAEAASLIASVIIWSSTVASRMLSA